MFTVACDEAGASQGSCQVGPRFWAEWRPALLAPTSRLSGARDKSGSHSQGGAGFVATRRYNP